MVIWTRWGILGLVIPTALIVLAMIGAEKVATQRMRNEDRKPVKQAPVADDAEETTPEKDSEEVKEEMKAAERKRAAERERVVKRAKNVGYLIGGLASAVVLWPLGRWMNKSEIHTFVDQQTGQVAEVQLGGGHTMFFIPLEYWGFIWAAIGLFKFAG